jgi:hypothetical protein
MKTPGRLPLLLLALLSVPAAFAADAGGHRKLDGCVTLSPSHEGARFGSQYLLIRDGDAHYRIEFRQGGCSALYSGSVVVSTHGEANRLCASDTRVSSKAGTCHVSGVTLIDADEYRRYAGRFRQRR